jgi:hypothetical protein
MVPTQFHGRDAIVCHVFHVEVSAADQQLHDMLVLLVARLNQRRDATAGCLVDVDVRCVQKHLHDHLVALLRGNKQWRCVGMQVPQIHIDEWVREQLPHDVVMPEVRCNVKWRGSCRPSDLKRTFFKIRIERSLKAIVNREKREKLIEENRNFVWVDGRMSEKLPRRLHMALLRNFPQLCGPFQLFALPVDSACLLGQEHVHITERSVLSLIK